MILPSIEEVLEHFEITEDECVAVSSFDRNYIEKIGLKIAWELAKGKGRVIIDYDPAYPRVAIRTYTDTPNNQCECRKATFSEGRWHLEQVPTTPYITSKD